jgi:hypothetical protein
MRPETAGDWQRLIETGDTVEFVGFVGFVEFVGYQWRYGGETGDS